MDLLRQVAAWLSGKKLILAGIGLIVHGLIQVAGGEYDAGIKSILEGLAAIFARVALTKTESKVDTVQSQIVVVDSKVNEISS